MTSDGFNQLAYTLIEATLTLYGTNADGSPVLTAPIWNGPKAEGFKANAKWIVVKTRPTGATYPRNHPLVPEWSINIARVWALPLEALDGFQPGPGNYVLDVVWVEEETLQWHRKTFYGVTINEHELDAREIDGGFTDGQTFDAQYVAISSGEWPVPALGASLPYQVIYSGADGVVPLYSYDTGTAAFTALTDTTGRATIGYSGSLFQIRFNGGDPVVESNASGLGLSAALEAVPFPDELPRLDFYYGTTRLATVSENGLWARSFVESVPAAGPGKFAVKFASSVVATIAAAGVEAAAFDDEL